MAKNKQLILKECNTELVREGLLIKFEVRVNYTTIRYYVPIYCQEEFDDVLAALEFVNGYDLEEKDFIFTEKGFNFTVVDGDTISFDLAAMTKRNRPKPLRIRDLE